MTGWLFGNLVWATVVMLLVLAARRPVARLFGAGPAYALWLLVPVRLALPPLALPAIPMSSLFPSPAIIVPAGETAASLPPEGGPGQWVPLLLAIWAGGAAVFLVRQWLVYRHFLTRLSLSSKSLGAHAGIPLIESAAVRGPLALGLLDRRIIVPADFAFRYAPDEQRLALDHEAIHHRRGDIWFNHAALVLLALNWFNPVGWLAFRAFREDQELSCDCAVAARAAPRARHDYARALVKSASRSGLIAACPLNRADQLKRRLKMMNEHRSSRWRLFGGGAAVLALGAASLALGSPGATHPHPDGDDGERRRERIIIMDQKSEPGAEGERRQRRLLLGRGDGGEIELPEGCEDGRRVADIEEGSGDGRARIVLCGRGEMSAEQRLEMLQRARERLAQNDDFGARHRERILESLDREIARARSR